MPYLRMVLKAVAITSVPVCVSSLIVFMLLPVSLLNFTFGQQFPGILNLASKSETSQPVPDVPDHSSWWSLCPEAGSGPVASATSFSIDVQPP